eukprot:m.52729 g.52729  ORF g.52729 m.52729 type:complete len:981 (-) comp11792_c0_seq1:836-3778(-)
MSESVRVAVRVRPFNSREKARNAFSIITMKDKSTTIKDPNNAENVKTFHFDYSYWSHDQFIEEPNGYLRPAGSVYADQKRVFEDLGRGVLQNAWAGYNCSLFAYGQTGSGKSYSMVGYGTNTGIVPVTCEELFKEIQSGRHAGTEFEVTFSMLEIYNEQVQDLLGSHVKGGMKIREHPKKGFYVEDLNVIPVQSFKEIEDQMEAGTRNRTIAATNMNATSSRAHTVVTINFNQKTDNAQGKGMTKTSNINLVDLAGSERADATGATGDRLKEGASINQSLSALGNVISALVDVQSGNKGKIVPYRDSTLTKLLKNALGGNSKTIMIAALSPADINYDETLSTLRFADRVKSIKTSAVVNESPTEKLIRELREENARLQAMLSGGSTSVPVVGAGKNISDEEIERIREEATEELKRQLEHNAKEMEEMKKSWTDRLKERASGPQADEVDALKQKRKVTAHFWNLNEDPSLEGVVCHFVEKGTTTIGRVGSGPQFIQMSGLHILDKHAIVTYDGTKIFIKKAVPEAKILVDGSPLRSEGAELHHHSRVMFGSSSLFCFTLPSERDAAATAGQVLHTPTYEDAQHEIAEKSGLMRHRAGLTKEDLLLQEELISILPHVNEANAISEEIDAKKSFEIVLISAAARGLRDGPTQVMIKMSDLTTEHTWLWSRSKFLSRKYAMQEVYQNFINGEEWMRSNEDDPFYDPYDAEVHIATAFLYLKFMGYLVDFEDVCPLTNFRGVEQGHLQISMVPCSPRGEPLKEDVDDLFVEDPAELVGRRVDYLLRISAIKGLPQKFNKNVYCKYSFFGDEQPVSTPVLADASTGRFDYSRQLTFNPVTKELVDHLESQSLSFEVYGQQTAVVSKTGATAELMKSTLMSRGLTLMSSGSDAGEMKRLQAERTLAERRLERANARLHRVEELLKAYKGSNSIPVDELHRALYSANARFRAAARMLIMSNRASRFSAEPGAAGAMAPDKGTQVCSLQ